ncbi:acetate/propionate family kinase [Pannonibacter phragmitetus]|uniref:Acetate kinase n=1 Tax=Pannonibacter phragmitetus TaxID=121719 RepID=A0A0U3P321_9HYPH|nr:acetate/propionate family kinase [Pannonibacter phragmitetus]ALV26213.1 acetate kinase [Pannonibacter phragmitetus]
MSSAQMDQAVLVLNAGSSSLKFNLYQGTAELLKGQVEGIGSTAMRLKTQRPSDGTRLDATLEAPAGAASATGHEAALAAVLGLIREAFEGLRISAAGHRVVHGGIGFEAPAVIDDSVMAELERLVPLAPLHQPHNLAGIRAAQKAFPDALQVACFDTAFHRNHPWVNDAFALPLPLYDEGVRRYGFHGLSYEYITQHLAETGAATGRLIVAHLGNGASMCAIQDGRSIGSTMGFTALDGLPMGTRCGQLDPGVLLYLMQEKGMTAEAISDLLYKQSGLSQDMRELEAAGTEAARKAIDYFTFRVRREMGAMAAILDGVDTIVFTGGIGEHAVNVRQAVCAPLGWLGANLDENANRSSARIISTPASRVTLMVVPTNEEEMIRRHTVKALGG